MTFEQSAQEFVKFSLTTFKEASASTSLRKLVGELAEVEFAIREEDSKDALAVEYADCVMCLFDSAARVEVSPDKLIAAFIKKVAINKARTWSKNPDGTYSHVKSTNQTTQQ